VDTLPITKRRGNLAFPKNKAFTLANEDSPAYLPGAFELAVGSLAAVPRITESFRSGLGMGWHEHTDGVFHGCEKFFRPGYAANLVRIVREAGSWDEQLRNRGLNFTSTRSKPLLRLRSGE
jgi:hypothetical protein